METSPFLDSVNQKILSIIKDNSSPFLQEVIADHFSHPGKMLRPQLAHGIGQSLSVPEHLLVSWAAACEIFHNATLIHDDLQDGDEYRRGHPTTWKKYGAAQAINAGDLLLMCGQQIIYNSDLSADKQIQLAALFSKMGCKIVNGQTLEFSVKDLSDLPNIEKNYIECIGLKTAALFADLAVGVALLANKDTNFQNKIHHIFDLLGKIFQIQDDILDLYGDKGRGQKGCDLQEGKMSFLVVTHLKHHPLDLHIIKPILVKPRDATTFQDIENIENLFQQKQTLEKSLTEMNTMISTIRNDIWLKENVALYKYTNELLTKLLKPIQFLFKIS